MTETGKAFKFRITFKKMRKNDRDNERELKEVVISHTAVQDLLNLSLAALMQEAEPFANIN